MNKVTFFRSVALAFFLSLIAGALFVFLTSIFSSAWAIRFTISFVSFAYIVYLLKVSDHRIGRLICLVLVTGLMMAAAYFPFGVGLYAAFHIGMIWVVRSLYFHNGLFVSLADLSLCVLSFAFAVWAISQSSSIFLAFWSFFLAQACVLPVLKTVFDSFLSKQTSIPNVNDQKKFQDAHRMAESALRRVLQA